jgi:hypothetical protein
VGAPTKRPIFGQRFSVTPNTPTQGVWAELREGTPAKIWESTGGFAEVEKTETGGLMVKVVTAATQAPSSTSDGSATVSGTVTVQDIPVLSDPANSSAGAIFKSPAPSSSATPEALAITSGALSFIPGYFQYTCNLSTGGKVVIQVPNTNSNSSFALGVDPNASCTYYAPGSTVGVPATSGRFFNVSTSTATITLVGVDFGSGDLAGTLDGWFKYSFPLL